MYSARRRLHPDERSDHGGPSPPAAVVQWGALSGQAKTESDRPGGNAGVARTPG